MTETSQKSLCLVLLYHDTDTAQQMENQYSQMCLNAQKGYTVYDFIHPIRFPMEKKIEQINCPDKKVEKYSYLMTDSDIKEIIFWQNKQLISDTIVLATQKAFQISNVKLYERIGQDKKLRILVVLDDSQFDESNSSIVPFENFNSLATVLDDANPFSRISSYQQGKVYSNSPRNEAGSPNSSFFGNSEDETKAQTDEESKRHSFYYDNENEETQGAQYIYMTLKNQSSRIEFVINKLKGEKKFYFLKKFEHRIFNESTQLYPENYYIFMLDRYFDLSDDQFQMLKDMMEYEKFCIFDICHKTTRSFLFAIDQMNEYYKKGKLVRIQHTQSSDKNFDGVLFTQIRERLMKVKKNILQK